LNNHHACRSDGAERRTTVQPFAASHYAQRCGPSAAVKHTRSRFDRLAPSIHTPTPAQTFHSSKLAAATADRVVHVYDEAGTKRDKFRTKAADGNASGAYLISGLAFSPDSSKLAVAQSDAVVFVYRLGAGWDEKKSICNKFAQSGGVACLAWVPERHGDVCFGLMDGKVKLGMLKTNKTYTLYAHPDGSPVVALVASPDGRSLVSGHADGSLYLFSFPEQQVGGLGVVSDERVGVTQTARGLTDRSSHPSCFINSPTNQKQQDGSGAAGCLKLAHHSCAPIVLAWGESLLATGSDCRVVFYDPSSGREQQVFDHSSDDEARSFGCAAINPSGDAAVVGDYNRLYVFTRGGAGAKGGGWQAAGITQVKNLLSATSLAWKPDGSKLVVGGLRGSVDVWDTCIKRTRHKGKFELTCVSKRAVIVKMLATGSRIVLKSGLGRSCMHGRGCCDLGAGVSEMHALVCTRSAG